MTTFLKKVYAAVAKIPKGKVMTYGEVARRVGVRRGARAVGNALVKNPSWPEIPCHRVVRADGYVGGWSGRGGKNKKISLLLQEGHEIYRGKLVRR